MKKKEKKKEWADRRCGVRTSVIPGASVRSGGGGFPLLVGRGRRGGVIGYRVLYRRRRSPANQAGRGEWEYVNGSITAPLSSISGFIPPTKGMFRLLARSKRA